MTARPGQRITRDGRRRFHWHEYFLALRRRDPELARFHRQIAQKLQSGGGRPPGPFRRVSSSGRLTGRPGPRPRAVIAAMRQAAGKPAAAAKPSSEPSSSAGSISSSKATKVESVVLTTSDQVDRRDRAIKRKHRKRTIPLAGRAENEPGSGARISKKKEPTCRRCGCTQYNACEDLRLMDSCCWVGKDLCSACLTDKEFKAWRSGRAIQ